MSVLLERSPYALILFLLLVHCKNAHSASCPINNPSGGFYRLGQSRFYIKAQEGGFSGNEDASAFCKTKDLRLASINDLTESVYAGRELEALVYKQRQLRNILFFLNARYDETRATYVWKTSANPAILYQNIHYFPPNELGRGQSLVFPNRTLCLVFGSPYPVSKNPDTINIYGWSTSMIEWPCTDNLGKSSKKGSFKLGALCESVDPECDRMRESSYDLDQNSYSGLFPLANRRFVISWEQMNQVEAVEFCMNYQLALYSPTEGDACLLPYIKDHWPDVTRTSFWTASKYNKQKQTLKHEDGSLTEMILMKEPPEVNEGEEGEDTCTSMSYTNERNDSMAKCKCRWNMMVQALSNCNMPAGVICQHKDYALRTCLTKSDGKLTQEFVTSLGDKKNQFFRSVRKQEYKVAEAKCKELKYELVKPESMLFQGSFVLDNIILYDLQTYWVSNPEAAQNAGGPMSLPSLAFHAECPVANVGGKQSFSESVFEKRKCVEKNFFLCEDKSVPA